MRRIGQAIVMLVLVAAASVAHASATPAQKCDAAKRKAVGKKLACRISCTAKAVGKGLPVTDPTVATCLSACDMKFSDAFAKAVQKGGCQSVGNADIVEGMVDDFLGTLETTTYSQGCWGNGDCLAENLLFRHFNAVYAATFGTLAVGIPPPGFAISFSGPTAVTAYLPQFGSIGALNANLGDPTSSSSGAYGGEVVALRLNVDFSDAGLLGPLAIPFGSLILCGLSADTDLNGMTVRQFLDSANTALGGGSTTDSISDLYSLAVQLNASFAGGTPSTFAKDHLVEGCCGLTLCGSQCVDPTSDPANCGSCGKRCNTSASDCNFCSSGMCEAFNLQNDPSNCGTCGHVCVSQVCSGGVCQ